MLGFDPRVLSTRIAIRGLLRSELAARAGISISAVSAAFAGRRIGVRVARQIAKALRCRLGDLIVSAADAPSAATAQLSPEPAR
ncbi:MAG: helix-turn-helix transcriptional regulator [Phycisphaerae bacterium]